MRSGGRARSAPAASHNGYHVDEQWWGPLRDLQPLLESGLVGGHREAPVDEGGIFMGCLASPAEAHIVHALERRADHAEFTCSHGCDEELIRARLLLAQFLVDDLSAAEEQGASWYESAAALLAEPDPGPTPFLVEDLLVDGAVGAIQGQHKCGKTWALLELALAIATGQRAFGRFDVPTPGPVLIVLEESGRAALHRRLDALRRGYGLGVAELTDLHFAANCRVRLDEEEWRHSLIEAATSLKARAVFLDPLVRLKGASVDENTQKEMAPVLDFMRDLRDAAGSAVIFTHHVGHDVTRLRGTSDLEAYWESKVTVGREPQGVRTLAAEHRESEAAPSLRYRLAWHDESASMRLDSIDDPPREERLEREVLEWVEAHPGQSTEAIATGVQRRRADVRKVLEEGPFERPSDARDGSGRSKGWNVAIESGKLTRPDFSDGSGRADEGDGGEPSHAPPTVPVGDGGLGTDDHAGHALGAME